MSNSKISALTSATTPLAGTEVLPIVQSGATVKVANNDLRPKQIQSNATSGVLQIAGPAAASTRVMTTPDANFTVARTDAAQSFTGDQTLSTGNLVIGTSGKGIDFSATPGTGTSELLADYEEGTWTPKDAVGANLTITGTAAYYRKVGSIVTITFDVTWTTNTVTTLTNLPFSNLGSHAGGCFAFNTTAAVASALILNGNTSIDLYNGINSSPNPASKRFIGSFVYQTS